MHVRLATAIGLLVLTAGACGVDEQDEFVEGWQAEQPGELPAIDVFYGEAGHCDYSSLVFLTLPPATGGELRQRTYVRDAEGELAHTTAAPFLPEADLPDDAEPSGWVNAAGFELWFAESDAGRYAYVVIEDRAAEAWPAIGELACG